MGVVTNSNSLVPGGLCKWVVSEHFGVESGLDRVDLAK